MFLCVLSIYAVGTCNKKRRVKKPWWNDNLSELWNERCNREKIYCRSVGLDRQHQRHLFRLSQKAFDREVQGAKRKYWRKQQDKLLTLHNSDSKQFWKSIGNIGVSVGKARIGACISDARRTLKAVEQPASHTNVPPMDVSYHPEMSKPGRPVQRLVIEALYRCLRSVALSVLLRWLAQRCTRVGNLQACGSEVSRVGGISEWTCYINHDPPPVGMVSTRPVGMVSTWPVEVPWPVQQPWLHVKMYQGLAR